MDKEKTFVGRWWVWMLTLVVFSGMVFGILGAIGYIGGTILERKVFENSFQYDQARQSELAIWQAEMANISSLISDPGTTEGDRSVLKARQRALRIRIANANRQSNNVLLK